MNRYSMNTNEKCKCFNDFYKCRITRFNDVINRSVAHFYFQYNYFVITFYSFFDYKSIMDNL